MAYHYNTRARARSDVEPDDISSGDLDVDTTIASVSESIIVGSRVESVEELESQPIEVAGSSPSTDSTLDPTIVDSETEAIVVSTSRSPKLMSSGSTSLRALARVL